MFNYTLMILHYHRHNKTPVWAHNHDLFDEHRHLIKLKEISQNHGTKYSKAQTELGGSGKKEKLSVVAKQIDIQSTS